MSVLYALLFFGLLGAVAGLALAFFDKKLSVGADEREESLVALLPGANCGGCGFAGCASMAKALLEGKAEASGCGACSAENRAQINAILGKAPAEGKRYRAQVMCSGTNEYAVKKYIYKGIADCHAAAKLGGGPKLCPDGCIGLGSCVKSCKFDAITVINGVAAVDFDKCVGCGACTVSCPKGLIKLIPYDACHWVGCSSKERSDAVKKFCDVGCIGCGICERACASGAITKTGTLASIDYAKCTDCGSCVAKCPRKIIWSPSVQDDSGLTIPSGAVPHEWSIKQ